MLHRAWHDLSSTNWRRACVGPISTRLVNCNTLQAEVKIVSTILPMETESRCDISCPSWPWVSTILKCLGLVDFPHAQIFLVFVYRVMLNSWAPGCRSSSPTALSRRPPAWWLCPHPPDQGWQSSADWTGILLILLFYWFVLLILMKSLGCLFCSWRILTRHGRPPSSGRLNINAMCVFCV